MTTEYRSIIGVGAECESEEDAFFEFVDAYDIIVLAECEGSMELPFGVATKAQSAIKEYTKASGKEAKVYLINYSF